MYDNDFRKAQSQRILSIYGNNIPLDPIEKSEDNDIQKAEFSTQERKKLAKEGEAEKNGSYPIENESDLHNAIQAYGRSKDKEATKAWIKKRAKELGKESMLPENWESDSKVEKSQSAFDIIKSLAGDIQKGGDDNEVIDDKMKEQKKESEETAPESSERGEPEDMDDEAIKKAGIEPTMKEFKEGTLKDSAGNKVTDRKQAIAIGLSEQRRKDGIKKSEGTYARAYTADGTPDFIKSQQARILACYNIDTDDKG